MLFKINDINTFKQYINVSFTFDNNNNFAGLKEAEEDYLEPILGEELYTELNDVVNTDGDIPEEYTKILNLCRKVIAPMSILLGISTRHIKIGDTGLKKTTAEGVENIFNWEYREVKEELQDKVAKALDRLWKFLHEDGKANFDWTDPTHIKTIFKTAEDFSDHYTLYQPYRVFPLLNPIIAKTEKLYVHDAIGKDFYDELIALDGTDNSIEVEAINLLKDAIAHFTVSQAATELPVKVMGRGFTVLFSEATDEPFSGDRTAPLVLLNALKDSSYKDGRTFMSRLKKYLNDTASDAVFATYKNSSFYAASGVKKECKNEHRKGIVRL